MNKWSKLNTFELYEKGRSFAEIAFVEVGFDVYISSRHGRTIDLVLKKDKKYYDVQVSSLRESSMNEYYAYARKNVFQPRKNLLFALLIFGDKKLPDTYLIPSLEWRKNEYDFLIEGKGSFENGKDKPEFAISINRSRIDLFKKEFSFRKQVVKL
jgi:hypothetical protein